MKCVIGNQGLGVWCRILHTLTQVGDQNIFFDFSDDIMTISTTNSSMSIFSTFLVFKSFFQSYSMTSKEPEKVAIPPKIILKPFRTQKMARNHLTSEIEYTANSDYVIVKSEGKSRAACTYRLGASVHDNDIQFECDPYTYNYMLKIDAKVLSSCLANFTHMKGFAELALKIQGPRVTFRNTVTDVSRKDGSVVTEYNLSSHDFKEFQVPDVESVEFMFGYREFKMFTTLAEQLKQPIYIYFQNAEDPVVVVISSETFEARLCMATRFNDPFSGLGPPSANGVPASYGSDGRISNVSSQSSASGSSTASRNGPPQEINRNQITASRALGTPSVNNPEPPPAKRLRRTEAEAPPPATLSHSESPDNNGSIVFDLPLPGISSVQPAEGIGDAESDPPPVENIGDLVEKIDKRNKSHAYKAIKRIIARPRMTEQDYLKTIPGHDVVLCPASDDEDSS